MALLEIFLEDDTIALIVTLGGAGYALYRMGLLPNLLA
jgi:hypothetical protein